MKSRLTENAYVLASGGLQRPPKRGRVRQHQIARRALEKCEMTGDLTRVYWETELEVLEDEMNTYELAAVWEEGDPMLEVSRREALRRSQGR